MSSQSKEDNWLLYDGECPLCMNYVKMYRIRHNVPGFRLIDARLRGPEYVDVTAQGFNIDTGMMLYYGGSLYYAEDAVHMLALLSSGSGLFNKINAAVFRSKTRARVIYPVLKTGRGCLLKILGRPKIN